MMFRATYDNPWLVTAAMGAISFVGMGLWLRRGLFLTTYLSIFTVVTLADALRSGSWSPLHLLASDWEDPVGLVFVMLGDFRYYLLLERFAWRPDAGSRDATTPAAVLTSLFLMVSVPLLVLAVQQRSPTFAAGRPLYLLWEVLFVVVASMHRWVFLSRRLATPSPSTRRWLWEVSGFELGTYGLWIVADLVIVSGFEWGYALRILPNFLYYGFFLLFVAYRAPREVTE